MTPHQRKKRSLKKHNFNTNPSFFEDLVQSLKEAKKRAEEYSVKTSKPFHKRLKEIISEMEITVDKNEG